MPQKKKSKKCIDTADRHFGEVFSEVSVVRTTCDGCGLVLAHSSHDCPFCHCPMHVWCGLSVEETHGHIEEEVAEGHGVPRFLSKMFRG